MDYNNYNEPDERAVIVGGAYSQCVRRCRCRGFYHVIKQGDTLYKLSRQYKVTVSAIMLANPYINIYNLQIGDEICIPGAPE